MSLFFSPKQPNSSVIRGVGPVLVFPTATEALLGSKKWSLGPGFVALTLRESWTVGILAKHIWSVAGNSARQNISNTYVQPFATYTLPSALTFSIQTEAGHNWKSKQWSVPMNIGMSKLVRTGKLPVSLQAGVGCSAEVPASGPRGSGIDCRPKSSCPAHCGPGAIERACLVPGPTTASPAVNRQDACAIL